MALAPLPILAPIQSTVSEVQSTEGIVTCSLIIKLSIDY